MILLMSFSDNPSGPSLKRQASLPSQSNTGSGFLIFFKRRKFWQIILDESNSRPQWHSSDSAGRCQAINEPNTTVRSVGQHSWYSWCTKWCWYPGESEHESKRWPWKDRIRDSNDFKCPITCPIFLNRSSVTRCEMPIQPNNKVKNNSCIQNCPIALRQGARRQYLGNINQGLSPILQPPCSQRVDVYFPLCFSSLPWLHDCYLCLCGDAPRFPSRYEGTSSTHTYRVRRHEGFPEWKNYSLRIAFRLAGRIATWKPGLRDH